MNKKDQLIVHIMKFASDKEVKRLLYRFKLEEPKIDRFYRLPGKEITNYEPKGTNSANRITLYNDDSYVLLNNLSYKNLVYLTEVLNLHLEEGDEN